MTSGGNMYHDRGYAGLPAQCHPKGGELDQKLEIRSGGQNKVLNAGGEAFFDSPFRASGALLFEQVHS